MAARAERRRFWEPRARENGRTHFERPALTGSAERSEQLVERGGLRRLDQAWQREAMRCYREIGECWNPAQYYSRALERIRFFPALLNERGQPSEVKDGPVLDLFRRIRTPGGAPGDLAPLAGAYGRLQFLLGDGHLLVSADGDGGEGWEYLSPMELRLKPESKGRQEYMRLRTPGSMPEDLFEAADDEFEPVGDRVRVWRLWRPHPEFSQWADSPIRPVLFLYRLLERATGAAMAEASSRMAQRGAFYVPEEWSFGPVDSSQEENPDEDPLVAELARAAARAIRNPDSAEAMMPFIIRGPGTTSTSQGVIPSKELAGHIPMGPEDRYPEMSLWDSVIGRIAGAIDMPKELLTGVGDVSHWGQWFLDDVGFRQHTGPTVVRFCGDVANAYLRPAAEEEGIADAERITIWFDPSQAVNHPDETGTALKAHDQLIISDAYAREKIGAPDTSEPDEEELKRRIQIKLKQDPYAPEQPEEPQGAVAPADGGRGGDVVQGEPPRRSKARSPNPPSPEGPSLAQMVAGAAMLQLDWARERAGNRVKSLSRSQPQCQEIIAGVAPPLVPSVLGREEVLRVIDGHELEQMLVSGTGDRFAARLKMWKLDPGWSEQLGTMVEQYALRTLYETEVPPLPAGFVAACRRAVGEVVESAV